jgi:hypothetical protein
MPTSERFLNLFKTEKYSLAAAENMSSNPSSRIHPGTMP